MKKYLFFLMSLWLAACSGGLKSPAIVIDTGAQPAAAMQLSPVATGTASPTGTSSPTVSPTPIDYGPIPVTQTVVSVKGTDVELDRIDLSNKLTEVYLKDLQGQATSTSAVLTSTVAAAQTQTPDAVALSTAQMSSTQTPEAILYKKQVAEADWQLKINQGVPVLVGVAAVMIVLVGMAATAFLRAGIKAKQEERRLYAQSNQRTSDAPKNELSLKLDMRDEYNYGAVDYVSCPLDKKTLEDVARLIVEHGARYTQAQMTGAGRPLVKDGNYDTFGNWMVKNKIAIRLDDGRYQIEHGEFFSQVLNK